MLQLSWQAGSVLSIEVCNFSECFYEAAAYDCRSNIDSSLLLALKRLAHLFVARYCVDLLAQVGNCCCHSVWA